jgi:hypothetical protein
MLTGYIDMVESDEEFPYDIGLFLEEADNNGDDFYYIIKKGKGKKLTRHMGQRVKVTGKLNIDKKGNKILRVEKFEILKEPQNLDIIDL